MQTDAGVSGSGYRYVHRRMERILRGRKFQLLNRKYIGCSGDTYSNRIEFNCDRFDGATGRIFSVEE
jgi:hypothetical protein